MLRLRYAQRSRADLVDIWDYISDDSPRNAEAVPDRIHSKAEMLRTQPMMGRRREDLPRGSRCVKSDGYMIFCRNCTDLTRVDRIVHHSRQLERISFEESV